jgi:hypothetical protein
MPFIFSLLSANEIEGKIKYKPGIGLSNNDAE